VPAARRVVALRCALAEVTGAESASSPANAAAAAQHMM